MCRVLYRLVAGLARLVVRSGRAKDLEIIALRHQLAVLQRHPKRPALCDDDRSLLAASAKALPAVRRQGWVVTPDTLLRWHRRRVARHWPHPPRRRIQHTAGIAPAPGRSSGTWPDFVRSPAAVACDFATTDTVTLRRYYLLFFIDLPTRQVFLGGITTNPTGAWTTQAARNLTLRHPDLLADAGALVRDRGSQFVAAFDEIFATEGLRILKTPIRTPVANAFAERWIGTLRRELLDRTLIWNQRQLHRLVTDYLDHYNTHRPHRALRQQPPIAPDEAPSQRPPPPLRVARSTRCNGLINEYRHAA